LKKRQYASLQRRKKDFRTLANKRMSLRKRKAIVQRGGFLTSLLVPAVAALRSILASRLSSARWKATCANYIWWTSSIVYINSYSDQHKQWPKRLGASSRQNAARREPAGRRKSKEIRRRIAQILTLARHQTVCQSTALQTSQEIDRRHHRKTAEQTDVRPSCTDAASVAAQVALCDRHRQRRRRRRRKRGRRRSVHLAAIARRKKSTTPTGRVTYKKENRNNLLNVNYTTPSLPGSFGAVLSLKRHTQLFASSSSHSSSE